MSRPPAILTSWFLPALSGLLTLLLAILCLWQWKMLADLSAATTTANQRADSAEKESAALRLQTDQLTGRNLAAEARVAELNRDLTDAKAKLAEMDALSARATALQSALAEARARIETANDRLEQANQNSANQQTDLLRLTAERDDLVRRLNERTEAYNALVKKSGGAE